MDEQDRGHNSPGQLETQVELLLDFRGLLDEEQDRGHNSFSR
jgi:hypothetical protein